MKKIVIIVLVAFGTSLAVYTGINDQKTIKKQKPNVTIKQNVVRPIWK